MSTIDFTELPAGTLSVEASLIAHDLGLSPAQVLERLRAGELTARCEQGIGEDVGRFRLTFYHDTRQLRLIVDQSGRILQRSMVQRRRMPPRTVPRRHVDG